ncbi:alpha/beta fold hydrolase [Haliangium sp.]|uniref:alpha/beta fold hydrolase n=1 Tax=Haliangium sp. TaxID=2663208 RepID=UPI003D0C0F7C
MKERAYLLGPNQSLLTIVSEPDSAPPPERPTFILLNAGIVHRIGPHRKTVKLARALCEAGFRAVRLDLSGIGDSAARRDALSFEEGALADLAELFDDLEKRYDTHRFALMGLCSGADNSFNMAVRDSRVVGAILLDGLAYRTRRYYLHYYGDRVRRPGSWVTLAKKVRKRIKNQLRHVLADDTYVADESAPREPVPDYVREFEPQEQVTRKLQQLIDRGVHMYWVYTSGTELYYNYPSQFFDMFKSVDFKNRISHDYFGDSNHTFTELRSQELLVNAVTRWATRTLA